MSATILVIDSDAAVVSAYKRTLERHGYEILGASSAKEGLQILTKERPEAVIQDVRVPGPLSASFLMRVKALYPSLPVIAVTAFSTTFTEADAKRAGANGYFVKPFDVHSLIEKLQDMAVSCKGRGR